MNLSTSQQQDLKYCWHPFTQAAFGVSNICVEKAQGIYLYDENGQAYIDAISSWWVVTHGHNQPEIVAAIVAQAQKLSHTLFSGVTHPPAAEFASQLVQHLQNKGLDFQWLFYSDNGSTAIEAALKMAVQYHDNLQQKNNVINHLVNHSIDQPQVAQKRLKFLAFEGAYHGDTFGAMSVGKTSGFYRAFNDWLFDVDFIEYPQIINDNKTNEDVFSPQLNTQEQQILEKTEYYLAQNNAHIAAFIFEPIIQGASGMRFAKIIFLQKLLALLKKYKILVIADEVMTGFGRTGRLFACEYLMDGAGANGDYEGFSALQNHVDILCLSKGITGGFLPMGATVVRDEIYQAFLSDDVYHAFLHGHSYTANPLACAAALANLKLFEAAQSVQSVKFLAFKKLKAQTATFKIKSQEIQAWHIEFLDDLISDLTKKYPKSLFKNPRVLGAIAAFDGLNYFFNEVLLGDTKENYGSKASQILRLACLQNGILLRPLGDSIYIMPPYCIEKKELAKIYRGLAAALDPIVLQNIIDLNYKNYKNDEGSDLF